MTGSDWSLSPPPRRAGHGGWEEGCSQQEVGNFHRRDGSRDSGLIVKLHAHGGASYVGPSGSIRSSGSRRTSRFLSVSMPQTLSLHRVRHDSTLFHPLRARQREREGETEKRELFSVTGETDADCCLFSTRDRICQLTVRTLDQHVASLNQDQSTNEAKTGDSLASDAGYLAASRPHIIKGPRPVARALTPPT